MPSQMTEYPRASAALAGLGLTTQIALAATDGVPIVKQIVGVVARIVILAQEIEAHRDALHALAENARSMGRRVEAVAAEHEMEGEMLSTLESLYRVLSSVETLLAKHNAKPRFQKALSYVFTVKGQVDRLNQELSRAVQEFLLVAALDTNGRVKQNSRCIGKFRLLHDFEVDKLEVIAQDKRRDSLFNVKYYTARIEGCGPVFAAIQVIDAATYLEEIGARWHPTFGNHIFIDEAGTPTIGLKHDLLALSKVALYQYHNPLAALGDLFIGSLVLQVAHTPVQLANDMFPDLPLEELFNTSERVWTRHQVTPRTVPGSYSVNQKTAIRAALGTAAKGDQTQPPLLATMNPAPPAPPRAAAGAIAAAASLTLQRGLDSGGTRSTRNARAYACAGTLGLA
ncbi:hypothetical protein AURDEDRAFT_164172 [Auricularia subglabra TFB-10046 SS5]|nr:hypothetical protein AURDEDRAFT_164172 [Auricularia subglabra TFB-10046 SS5]